MNKETNKQDRLQNTNEFIAVIAGCGHKFFNHKRRVGRFEMSTHGRIFFIDDYTEKRIYTHDNAGRWRGFTHGGTMRGLICGLRDYITKGETLRAGYFQPIMDNGFENPWGYGDDILVVKAAAIRLGIAK